MSGVTKAIGTIFKPIVKAAKWVIPVVALGAAAIFTGGAALGAAPGILGALGGGAASAVTGALGIAAESTLGTVLTGAVSTAVTGGLVGGAVAAVTGGKVLKGIGYGALTGAAVGGLSAGLGSAFAPATTTSGINTLDEAGNVVQAGSGLPVGSLSPEESPDSALAATSSSRPGMLGEFWEKAKQNNFASTPSGGTSGGIGSDLVSGIVKGVGQGLTEQAKFDAEQDAVNQNRTRTEGNYRTGGRGLFGQDALNIINSGSASPPSVSPPASLTPIAANVAAPINPQPVAPWDYEYIYDTQAKQFKRVPIARGGSLIA